MCTVLLPPGEKPTAVNKYIKYRRFPRLKRRKDDRLCVRPSVLLSVYPMHQRDSLWVDLSEICYKGLP